MAKTLGIFVSIQPSLDVIERTADSLESPFKEAFLEDVRRLVEGLSPSDLVAKKCDPSLLDGHGHVAAEAGDQCIGVLEIPGLLELCASATGASSSEGAQRNV